MTEPSLSPVVVPSGAVCRFCRLDIARGRKSGALWFPRTREWECRECVAEGRRVALQRAILDQGDLFGGA